MHELSIALSMLDMIEEEAAHRSGAVVKAVHVKLGPLSGVVKQALRSAYDLAREGTTLANCNLVVEDIPLIVRCRYLQRRRPAGIALLHGLRRCGASNVEVVSGRELEVAALEIES